MNDRARIDRDGYRSYDGPLLPVRTRLWVVALAELWICWKDRWFRRLLWFSFAPLLVFGGIVIVQANLERMTGEWQLWRTHWHLQAFAAMVISYLAGRHGIAADGRSGALWLYLSRPLRPAGYLLGKWLAIFLPAMAVLWIPQQLLATFRLAVGHGYPAGRWALDSLALMASTAAATSVLSVVMLGMASLFANPRAVGLGWVVLVIGLPSLAQGLAQGLSNDAWLLVSFFQASEELAATLLGTGTLPAIEPAASVVGWTAAGLAVAGWRLRRTIP